MQEVTEQEAKRLVTKRNIHRVFGRDAKLDRAFVVHPETKTRSEVYSVGDVNIFSISASAGSLVIMVNVNILSNEN